MAYSTKNISPLLIDEIKEALQSVSFGSIEIYVQDKKVTQITVRTIKKTSVEINSENSEEKNKAYKAKQYENKN